MKKHTVTKNSGFTLLELMITLSVVALLAAVGIPSVISFMQQNRVIASTNELISAFHVARTEAIKLNQRVTICESNDGKTCAADGSWRDGWIVFIDSDGNLSGTGAACANNTSDCLLRIHEGYDDPMLTIEGVDDNAAVASAFTFTSRGLPKSVTGAERSGTFSVCMFDEDDNVVASRAVVLGMSGRVRVSDNDAVIGCPASPG